MSILRTTSVNENYYLNEKIFKFQNLETVGIKLMKNIIYNVIFHVDTYPGQNKSTIEYAIDRSSFFSA